MSTPLITPYVKPINIAGWPRGAAMKCAEIEMAAGANAR